MTGIYDGRTYRRPGTCGCDKIPYRDEAAALAAADRYGAEFDTAFRAYKCTGTTVWHLATRGFRPSSLKSDARVLAWHVSVRRVLDRRWLLEQFRVGPEESAWTPAERNEARRVSKILREFAALGLAGLNEPRAGYVTALDYEGLLRVMAVGLQEYRGIPARLALRRTRPPRTPGG